MDAERAARRPIRIAGEKRAPRPTRLELSADPARWHGFSVELPKTGAPAELELAYENGDAGPTTRSIFLSEPSLEVPARGPPRAIVLFLIDTLRADHVGAYGYRLPTTPRLDSYFREGLRAEKCVAAANWTLPSHASLFASVPVSRHDAGRYGNVLAESFDTLAERMAAAGYRTLAVTGGGLVDPAFGMARVSSSGRPLRIPIWRGVLRELSSLSLPAALQTLHSRSNARVEDEGSRARI